MNGGTLERVTLFEGLDSGKIGKKTSPTDKPTSIKWWTIDSSLTNTTTALFILDADRIFRAPISLLIAAKQSSTVIDSSGKHLQPCRAVKVANPSESASIFQTPN